MTTIERGEGRSMSLKERSFVTAVLVAIVITVVVDLVTDFADGVQWWHVLIEGATAAAALTGIFVMLRGTFLLKRSLAEERRMSTELQAEAERWRATSKRHLEGLTQAIDAQLSSWKLTSSEKEVAFLLLKGLSLKEIATLRATTEKTTRAQSAAIYAKAGLAGRSELAGFFLEDLFPPVQG